jgi:hypothetical protein
MRGKGGDVNVAALGQRITGVDHQIQQSTFQLTGIGQRHRGLGSEIKSQGDAFADGPAQQVFQRTNVFVDIDRPGVQRKLGVDSTNPRHPKDSPVIDSAAVLTVFLVYVAGVVIPGPNFVAVVHKAVAATRSEALALVAGIVVVNLLWATCAIAGIGVVFAAFPWAALVVKVPDLVRSAPAGQGRQQTTGT